MRATSQDPAWKWPGINPPAHSWFSGEERITVDLETARVLLASGSLEGIDRWADLHVNEADFLQHLLPGCTRQTTGDSSSPEIDILDSSGGNRLSICDVGELQMTARPQHPIDFVEYRLLVGA